MHMGPVWAVAVVAVLIVLVYVGTGWAAAPDFGSPVCPAPAVTGLKVVNDRWPDASSPLQFARDAIRLENARTDQEKAIAIWLWVRRFTMYTSGTPPTERVASGKGYVSDPMKILNVWGAHWCDGLSRCMELCWRHLGYPAQKFYKAGHTLCDAYWVDADGVGRYHLFDVSEGWFAFTRDGSRIAGAEDLVRDGSLVHRPAIGPQLRHESTASIWGWVHATHIPWDSGHRVELTLRPGESFLRLWGNVGRPFQDNVGRKGDNVPEEHGPYPVDYGNGVLTFRADLTVGGLESQCFQPPANCKASAGKVEQADRAKPAVLIYRIRTGFIISSLVVRPAGGRVQVELSDDGGKNWRTFGQSPDKDGPEYELAPATKDGREINAFGRYDVLVRLSVLEGALTGLEFLTTVQQNLYSLPQLHPGDNQIAIRGQLAKGAAVRVTYVWSDPAGKDRTNVTVAESLPHSYTIRAAGSRWGEVVCKSLNVEVVPANGRGNRTEVKEADSPLQRIEPLPDYLVSLGKDRDKAVRQVPPLKPLEDCLAVLADPAVGKPDLHQALAAVRIISDVKAYDAVRTVAMTSLDLPKIHALQTMYWLDRKRALPEFLQIIREQCPDIRYKQDEKDPRVRAGHYFAVVCQLSRFLADERVVEVVPALVRIVQATDGEGMWDEPRRGIIRSLGELGDKSAVPALMKLAGGEVDDAEVAVEALGKLGDAQAIPAVRKVAASSYTPLRAGAIRALGLLNDRESVELFRKALTDPDDDARSSAAEALAHVSDRSSLDALNRQLAVEQVVFVREAIRRGIDRLGK